MKIEKMEISLSRVTHYLVKKPSEDMLECWEMSSSDYKHLSTPKIEYRNEYETSIDKITQGNC
jgi:hypothetical protein